jgi:hypothetical protein
LTNDNKLISADRSFPSAWPDGCPPAEAAAPKSTYYRIVKSDPLDQEDFLSYVELGKSLKGADRCRLCGISLYDTWEAADIARANFPAIGDLIARGKLTEANGLFKQTGTNLHHYTWWPFEGVDRVSPFQIQLVAGQ